MARDSVQVINRGDKTFVNFFEKHKTEIRPGGVAYVPWKAACIWFGNPELRNTETSKQREQEFKHLLARYGVYYHTDRIDELFPKCEVYSLEGERIYMVMDDPDGRLALNPTGTDASSTESEILQRRAYDLEQQMNAVLAVLAEINPDAAAKLAERLPTASAQVTPAGADAVPAGVNPRPPLPGTALAGSDTRPIAGPPSAAFITPDPSQLDTQPAVGDTAALASVGAPTDGPNRSIV